MAEDYHTAFARDADEQITTLNNALLDLEADPEDESAIEQVFRTAHTLKGNCGAMGFTTASDLAHAIEDLLEAVRRGEVPVTPELMDTVFDAVDELEGMIDDVADHGEPQRAADDVIGDLQDHIQAAGAVPTPTEDEIRKLLSTVSTPSDEQYQVYHARIAVAGDPEVDGPDVIAGLEDAFDLLGTDPDAEAVEAGEYDGSFDAAFASVVEGSAVQDALDAVDAVEETNVTDVSEQYAESADSEDQVTADPTIDDDLANVDDLSVDELLEDDDVDQFDDLDEMAEDIEDTSEFDDMGDAGTFDDLDLDDDDLGLGGSDSDGADEADSEDTSDDETQESTVEAADDDEVEDASAEFEQLKQEVDPVGFDELQDELDDLEFDEYDNDDEVGFDELLGEDELDDGLFEDEEEPVGDAEPSVEVDDESIEVDDPIQADELVEAGSESDEGHDDQAVSDQSDGQPASGEEAQPEGAAAEVDGDSFSTDDVELDASGQTDVVPDGEAADQATGGAAFDEVAADDAPDAGGFDFDTALEADDEDADTALETDDGVPEPDAGPGSVESGDTDETTVESIGEEFDLDDGDTGFGSDDGTELGSDDGASPIESDDDAAFGSDDGTAFDLEDEPAEFGGEVPGVEESDEDGETVGTADAADLEDDSFGNASDSFDDADDVAVDSVEVDEIDVEDDFGGDVDLGSGSVAGAGVDEESAEGLESTTVAVDDAGFEDPPEGADATVGGDEFGDAADAIDDSGFSDPDDGEIDEERLERIRSLGVPSRSDDGAGEAATQSIRVDVDQMDSMLNLVEGLVTSRARLRRALVEAEPREVLEEELDDLEEVTSELQDTVMDVRLVPLRTVVNTLPRTVRDVSREQGKEVEFSMLGEDVELDRTVLDEIGDPLVHLVRNAVDHGLEPPEEREAAGKDPEGSVELRARRERDRVYVVVEDDGRGLDADAIRDEAVEEGIASRAEVEAMADDEVYDLIFHAGFSTTEEVTDVSGRGVGMDVVAETVDRLDGEVHVDSVPGEGTTIELELPVTLAIAEVLFVEAGGEEYGIPLKVVDEIGPVAGVETRDGQEVLVSDGGESRELLRLDRELNTPRRSDDRSGMVVHLRDDVREASIHCDGVRGQQEVVVKPFEGVLESVPGLSGATVLGDGDVVNIIDVERL